MALPVSYNLRNLMVRKTTTVMTALGVALTVAVLLADLALVNGLREAFSSTGDPRNVLVLRKGGTSELNSGATRQQLQDIKFKPGIARNERNEPLASIEMITVISLKKENEASSKNITVRGLLPGGIEMRDVKITSGRWFAQGQREVVVGAGTLRRYPETGIGTKLRFGKGWWTVVGVMDAGQSATSSEMWADLNQVSSDFNRENQLNSILVRATDEVAAAALVNSLEDDQKLNMTARLEREYYRSQTSSSAPIQVLGIFVSIIMAVGSSFAAMNTMYAAVARRSREIGTLRILGFSQGNILTSFFLESLLLAGVGGLMGCLIAYPLNFVTTSIASFTSFSEIAFNFHVSPRIMGLGMLFALLMGAIGGFFPARSAAKKEILTALRQV